MDVKILNDTILIFESNTINENIIGPRLNRK